MSIFDELPDGKYQVRIDKAQVTRSNADDPMIKWELLVIAGSLETLEVTLTQYRTVKLPAPKS